MPRTLDLRARRDRLIDRASTVRIGAVWSTLTVTAALPTVSSASRARHRGDDVHALAQIEVVEAELGATRQELRALLVDHHTDRGA